MDYVLLKNVEEQLEHTKFMHLHKVHKIAFTKDEFFAALSTVDPKDRSTQSSTLEIRRMQLVESALFH